MSASDRESEDRPVLLCYDGSPDSVEAIQQAGELTGGGPALVLYVWLPPSALMLAGRIVADDHPLAPAIAEFDERAARGRRASGRQGVEIANKAGFEATPLTNGQHAERGARSSSSPKRMTFERWSLAPMVVPPQRRRCWGASPTVSSNTAVGRSWSSRAVRNTEPRGLS